MFIEVKDIETVCMMYNLFCYVDCKLFLSKVLTSIGAIGYNFFKGTLSFDPQLFLLPIININFLILDVCILK